MLATLEDVKEMLASGKTLVLAGDEALLASVPAGRWIGGTIPYFMDADGGVTTRDRLFVQVVPPEAKAATVSAYDLDSLKQVAVDSPDRGYSVLIIPAFTPIHQAYALDAPGYPDLFLKVIGGWIAGIHLDALGKRRPKDFAGTTGRSYEDRCLALHVELAPPFRAQLDIVNIFEPSTGTELRFPKPGCEVDDCVVNGVTRNFHDFLVENKIDIRLPLVAETFGALINVSIQSLDAGKRTVKLYAPVFDGLSYWPAQPLSNYPERFAVAIPHIETTPVFSCNCVLNYLYGQLEGRHTGRMTGPMTFGEIAFQLLNQTLVYVTLSRDAA